MDTPKTSMPFPDPAHPSEVRAFLREAGFHPSRVLGQNFLIDRNILDIVVAAAEVKEGDEVLEVGPGLGALTEALLAQGVRLTAVEKDKRLAGWLRERYADRCLRIPMVDEARSMNLGNSVAILCYEALRQRDFAGLRG